MTKTKNRSGRPVAKKLRTVGERIIAGLEEALAWSKGEELPVESHRCRCLMLTFRRSAGEWA